MGERTRWVHEGRWGVRQLCRGELLGSCTIWCGWPTREEAVAANPPHGDYTYEVYDRFALDREGGRP